MAEATTTEISTPKETSTFDENIDVARAGGEAAGEAWLAVEARTGVPVIISKNATQFHKVVTSLIESLGKIKGDEDSGDES